MSFKHSSYARVPGSNPGRTNFFVILVSAVFRWFSPADSDKAWWRRDWIEFGPCRLPLTPESVQSGYPSLAFSMVFHIVSTFSITITTFTTPPATKMKRKRTEEEELEKLLATLHHEIHHALKQAKGYERQRQSENLTQQSITSSDNPPVGTRGSLPSPAPPNFISWTDISPQSKVSSRSSRSSQSLLLSIHRFPSKPPETASRNIGLKEYWILYF